MTQRFFFLLTIMIITGALVYPVKGNEKNHLITVDSSLWETVIDGNSFANYTSFEKTWDYLYPWGEDHNGSARMIAGPKEHSYLSLQSGSILHIKADYVIGDIGNSNQNPYLKIKYRSGAIHAKQKVTVSDNYPQYEVSGYFKVPTVKGSWPAFWLTSVDGWPPESDILEYKGDNINWQNTFITPTQVTTVKTAIETAQTEWHQYKAVLKKVNSVDVDIYYYVDGKFTGMHRCNFMNKPMWVIINLQMEGSSGNPGPEVATDYFIKNVVIKRGKKE
jgi:hypothetical protein